jgi:RNA polymerase sigma factor (sigma-70 family)
MPELETIDDAGRIEGSADMVAALRRLPPRQRAVLVLRYYGDLSEADTADIMHCSIGTVKSQSARGLDALRAELHRTRGTREHPLRRTETAAGSCPDGRGPR